VDEKHMDEKHNEWPSKRVFFQSFLDLKNRLRRHKIISQFDKSFGRRAGLA